MFQLYFPEDKAEYIPAIISLILCIMATLLAIRLFEKISAIELKKAKMVEERMKELVAEQKANENNWKENN